MRIAKCAATLASYRTKQRDYGASFVPTLGEAVKKAKRHTVVSAPDLDKRWGEDCRRAMHNLLIDLSAERPGYVLG